MQSWITELYGDEYPAAVTIEGVRMPLDRETRFSRHYSDAEKRRGFQMSRFLDGSAFITIAELRSEWPAWTESQRQDFCSACSFIQKQSDLPDILRFVMQSPDPRHWSAIALSVSSALAGDEGFDLLCDALTKTGSVPSANIAQAIAVSKHPKAAGVLRRHLESLWTSSSLWRDDPFQNWVAFDATCCIQYLIELGVPPAEFAERVKQLMKHPCRGSRETCAAYLGKFFGPSAQLPKADRVLLELICPETASRIVLFGNGELETYGVEVGSSGTGGMFRFNDFHGFVNYINRFRRDWVDEDNEIPREKKIALLQWLKSEAIPGIRRAIQRSKRSET